MKKCCANCWYGGKGVKYVKRKVACQKLGTLVDAQKQRQSCKHYCTSPPERYLPSTSFWF